MNKLEKLVNVISDYKNNSNVDGLHLMFSKSGVLLDIKDVDVREYKNEYGENIRIVNVEVDERYRSWLED